MQRKSKNYLQLKRELVQQTAIKLNTTPQIITMAYADLIGNHLYDDELEYVREQMAYLDIDNLTIRPDLFWTKYELTPIEPDARKVVGQSITFK